MSTGSFSAAHLTGLSTALADRYRLERELGAGGMATVWLAEDLRHGRRVAIKVLHPELSAVLGPERFLAEIRTTAALQHPHILPLFDSGSAGGLLYYVMPFVAGETLRARLDRERQLPISDAVRVASEAGDALDYAHRTGVVHRDVKPENILLHDGHVLVADFGIALAVQQAGGQRMTQTGLSLGTPQYMAPEQAMGERMIDARADVYALGVVTYEMLAGEPPFSGPSAQAVIARLMTERPRPIAECRDTVPPHVADAVHHAMARLPADRFATAAEFRAALTTQGVTSPSTATTAAARVPESTRRWKLATAISALVAVMAVAAILLRTRDPATDSTPVRRLGMAFPEDQSLVLGWGGRVALSPDGATLVYTGAAPGGTMLLARRLDSLRARVLPGTADGANPTFSPDGKQVAFVSGNPLAIRVVPLDGGPPRIVTDSAVGRGGLAWGDDGYIYFDGDLPADGIARVLASGGPPSNVTRPDSSRSESWHSQPETVPGSRVLLFSVPRGGAFAGDYDIAAAELPSGRHHVLASGLRPRLVSARQLVWVGNDGALLTAAFDPGSLRLTSEPKAVLSGIALRGSARAELVVSQRAALLAYLAGSAGAGDHEFVWVDRAGRATLVDSTLRGRFQSFAVSPDGKRLAYTVNAGTEFQVWSKTLDHGPASRFSLEGLDNRSPAWSRDGSSLAYAAYGALGPRSRSVFIGPADGRTAPRMLATLDRQWSFVEVSPDGQWIVVADGRDVGLLPVSKQGSPRSLLATRAVEQSPAISPDGRWLAYASNESGRVEIYVRPFPDVAAAKWQVSTSGGSTPAWSTTRPELYYVSNEGQFIAAELRTNPTFEVLDRRTLFSTRPFEGLAGARFTYVADPGGDRFLALRPIGGAAAEQLVLVEGLSRLLRGSSAR